MAKLKRTIGLVVLMYMEKRSQSFGLKGIVGEEAKEYGLEDMVFDLSEESDWVVKSAVELMSEVVIEQGVEGTLNQISCIRQEI